MSDVSAAVLILPTLSALVLALEGSRIACGRLTQRVRKA